MLYMYFTLYPLYIHLCILLIQFVPWSMYPRRTRTPTWHSRKCLDHQRDPTCVCTRYPSPCWLMKRWRRYCRRLWQNTAAVPRLYDLRGSVLYLPDHPSVWPTLNRCHLQYVLCCCEHMNIHYKSLHTCSVLFRPIVPTVRDLT